MSILGSVPVPGLMKNVRRALTNAKKSDDARQHSKGDVMAGRENEFFYCQAVWEH